MADDVAEVAYAFVLDGVSTIFVSDEGLTTAWAVAAGFVLAHPGLVLPDSLTCSINIRLGELDDSDSEIKIRDVDGTLAALFAAGLDDSDFLITTLEPGPAAGASLFGKHVGLEAIGAAGERRRYSCVPGFAVGLRHLGENHAYALGLGPTTVTDTPRLWVGRRCAVYRAKKIAGTWQALSAATRVWFGTLLGQGSHDAGLWSFRCLGPESWPSGNIGTSAWESAREALPVLLVDGAAEELVEVSLALVRLSDPSDIHHTWLDGYEDTSSLAGTGGYADLVTAINAILNTVEADATSGDAFGEGNSQLRFSDEAGNDGFMIQWNSDVEDASGWPGGFGNRGVIQLSITMHEKVWYALGYDVRQQNADLDPVDQFDAFCLFDSTDVDGRWTGTFYSANAKAMQAFVSAEQDYSGLDEDDFTNGQFERRWPPIYSGGAVSWTGKAGQEFQIRSIEPLHMTGSLSRPVMDSPGSQAVAITIGGGVGVANRQGLLVVEGPYRRRGDNDKINPVEGYAFELERERREGRTIQVLRCAWREGNDGSVVNDSDGLPRLVVYAWENPKLYGFDFARFVGTWGAWRDAPEGARGLTVRPLTVLDYGSSGDRIDHVIMRVLATTGTAGTWYSDAGLTTPVFGLDPPNVYFDSGDNSVSADVPTDAEYAEFGCGVPASMIQTQAKFAAALLEVGPNLQRCKAGFAGPVSTRNLMRTLLAPTGLCMSLAGGKIGIFDLWRLPSPDEATADVDAEWYAGVPGMPRDSIPRQELRVFSPIDILDVKARIEPVEGKPFRTFKRKATDPGSRGRAATITHPVAADHVLHPSLPGVLGADWFSEFGPRWVKGFSFWGKQHFAVPLVCHAEDAIALWPGDSILLTDAWLADPTAGSYGISVAPGWIVSRSFDCAGEKVRIRVVVNAETTTVIYAPAAVATRYDENDLGLGYRLAVADDWLSCRGGLTFDCQGFAEASWSLEGGSALIEILQFDGVTWTAGIYGTVSSVTAAVGACWLNLSGALTGNTYYRDMHHVVILRKYSEQTAAWVLRWFAPLCLEDGTHSTGTVGIKLRA